MAEACSPAQRHLPVSGLTIWRKFKIERDNLGHLQYDNQETGKHKPVVFELTVMCRRWHLPRAAQVGSLGTWVHLSGGAEGWNAGEDEQTNARHKEKSSEMQITMLRSWLSTGSSGVLKLPPFPAPQAGIEHARSMYRSYIWLCQKAEIKLEPVCTLRKCKFAARLMSPLALWHFSYCPVKIF